MKAKGFLIRPQEKDIIEVEHETSDFKEIYKIIDCGNSPFDVIHLTDNNYIFVDDEGLLKDQRHYFTVEGRPFPLAGKGLVMGTSEGGDTVPPTITMDELKKLIGFTELKLVEFSVTEGATDVFGKPGWGIQSNPVFSGVDDNEDIE